MHGLVSRPCTTMIEFCPMFNNKIHCTSNILAGTVYINQAETAESEAEDDTSAVGHFFFLSISNRYVGCSRHEWCTNEQKILNIFSGHYCSGQSLLLQSEFEQTAATTMTVMMVMIVSVRIIVHFAFWQQNLSLSACDVP